MTRGLVFLYWSTNNSYENPTDKRDPDGFPLTDYVISEGSKLSFLQKDSSNSDYIQDGSWTEQRELPATIRYVFELE
jgi:hypothetical protein